MDIGVQNNFSYPWNKGFFSLIGSEKLDQIVQLSSKTAYENRNEICFNFSFLPNCFLTNRRLLKLNLKMFLVCRSLGHRNVWGSKLSDRQTFLHLAKKKVIVWFVLPSIYKVCQELLALTPASILEFEIDWKGPGPIL